MTSGMTRRFQAVVMASMNEAAYAGRDEPHDSSLPSPAIFAIDRDEWLSSSRDQQRATSR
jgi:hypothetical protein